MKYSISFLLADNRRYQYTYHNNQYITRESRMKANKCGTTFSKPQMLRIIGGEEAQRYKWPWHVAILNQFMVRIQKNVFRFLYTRKLHQ